MFKIPAWGDDVPKTESIFIQKIKKIEKPEINRKSPKDNHVIENNNNVTVNGLNHASLKRKFENNIMKSKKGTISNIKKKNFEETETIPETQNFDEILLNAKKKKFNAIFENDDKEELLFSESKQVKGNQIKTKISPNSLCKNNKSTKDVTKLNNKKKNTIVNEEINKNKKKVEVHEENEKTNIEVIAPVSNKKVRLLSLLESSSHRNPINVNQTGNKLRNRMLERLKAAQFRYLNEKLYTSSGSEAQQLFQTDPTAFETYHQGYQLQVKKWPVNPLDVIVKKIMKMPKTHTIADLGCGEAALSRRVPHKVRSFDLVATAPGVEACDMARTPLLTASMDVTVYCLALMGTDLTQYLVEANRVLKMGGHLLIAEVESRFDKVDNFVKDVERLGFKLKQLDKSNKVFFFMEFTKIRDPPVKKAKLPVLTLKPCLYKRR